MTTLSSGFKTVDQLYQRYLACMGVAKGEVPTVLQDRIAVQEAAKMALIKCHFSCGEELE
jgi:hypothetical protein